MGLFSPWFLTGLLAAALPLWIHLLRQHRSTPRPFASLMFFERRIQSSVKHRRLKFYTLLALRLAIILLLALLFANPYIKLDRAAMEGRKLTLIAVDKSFSMRYGSHLESAKQQALAAVPGNSEKAQVVAVSNRIDLATDVIQDRAALAAAIRGISQSDAASSYGEFARFLRGLPKSVNMPVEAHFYSDMQKSSMPPSFADLALADNLKLVLHSVAEKSQPNWTVENVSAPARVYSARHPRIQASVAGFDTPAARKTVTLVLNNKPVESKTIEIPESGRAQVEFTSMEAAYGANRAEVRLDNAGDSLGADDRFAFAIERADPSKVLFIREGRQTDLYYRTALASTADAGFDLVTVTADQAVNLPLDQYAYVVLATNIPGNLEGRLKEYVSAGRGLLVALGPTAVSAGRVPVTGDRVSETRYSTREGERFQTASNVDRSHPAMQHTDFSGVRFFQTARVEAGDASVLARLSDRTPLALDRKIGEGRVIVFASTFDNISNDLPLHAVFVPWVEQLSRYLEGGETVLPAQAVGSFAELRTGKDRGAAAEILDPEGKRALTLSEATTAKTYQFGREGFFDVRPASGRRQLIAVNAERRESDLTPVAADTLALWQGTGNTSKPGDATPGTTEQTPQSLWKYVLAALLGVTLVEMFVANRFTHAADDEKREIRRQAA